MAQRVPPPVDIVHYVRSVGAPPASQKGGPLGLPPTPAPIIGAQPSFSARVAQMRENRGARRLALIAIGLVVGLTIGIIATCCVVANANAQDTRSTAPAVTAHRVRTPPAASHTSRAKEAGLILTLGVLLGAAASRRAARARRERGEPQPEQPSNTAKEEVKPQRLGAASIVGNTRTENQDRVAVERVDNADVIIVADGLGGLPHGGEAAEFAKNFALGRLQTELPRVLSTGHEGVRTLLLSTIWETATRMTCEAHCQGWTGVDGGFRTTLVLVVALQGEYVTAWIGDGGVFAVRADDNVIQLLEPHKSAETPDILEASLGPASEGRPAWAIAPRQSGDLLLAATDGVADAFGLWLMKLTRRHLKKHRGDAVRAAEAVVEAIATRTGTDAITDNLTVALLTTEDASCSP